MFLIDLLNEVGLNYHFMIQVNEISPLYISLEKLLYTLYRKKKILFPEKFREIFI